MSSSFSDNSGIIWSGGGRVFGRATIEERGDGHTMSASEDVTFFRVRVRGERWSEAREKTARHVRLSMRVEIEFNILISSRVVWCRSIMR